MERNGSRSRMHAESRSALHVCPHACWHTLCVSARDFTFAPSSFIGCSCFFVVGCAHSRVSISALESVFDSLSLHVLSSWTSCLVSRVTVVKEIRCFLFLPDSRLLSCSSLPYAAIPRFPSLFALFFPSFPLPSSLSHSLPLTDLSLLSVRFFRPHLHSSTRISHAPLFPLESQAEAWTGDGTERVLC